MKVAFLTCTEARGKILATKREIVIVYWCCMNKEMGTQFLIFYIVLLQGTTHGLWFPLYLVFLGSFLGEGSSSLLKGGFEGRQITDVWNTIPFFFFYGAL